MKKIVLIASMLIMLIGRAGAQTEEETIKLIESKLKMCKITWIDDAAFEFDDLKISYGSESRNEVQKIYLFVFVNFSHTDNYETYSFYMPIKNCYFESLGDNKYRLKNKEEVCFVQHRAETMGGFDEIKTSYKSQVDGVFEIPPESFPEIENMLKHLQTFYK